MSLPEYDLAVIGGGIHGVGVAQAAAAAGYSVLVLEKTGLASGTSSRSSKLVHGGLRYLETAQLSLVSESLKERELLLKNAPTLVKRIPFFIPVTHTMQRSAFMIRCGLSLYALLGGLGEGLRFRSLPRSEWSGLDGLSTKTTTAVYQYWDAQTDDQALTKAVMHSASSLGAVLIMPAHFHKAERQDHAYLLDYHVEGQLRHSRAKVLVNAAGPWAGALNEKIFPRVPVVPHELVQGTHIVLKGTVQQGIYYLEALKDKRPVFVMPWKGGIMVGTTETVFKGEPSDVSPREDEQHYLLETLGHYFPRFATIQQKDLQSAFAGLRVLPGGNDRLGRRPRETVFQLDDVLEPRLLTIYGGKLTTYRRTAEKVMQHLKKSLPQVKKKANTKALKLAS